MTSKVLEVHVLEAKNLRGADKIKGNRTSDPYCYLKLDGSTAKGRSTSVVKDSLNPVWADERFVFDNINGRPLLGTEILTVKVFDKDFLPFDDLLGRVTLYLNDLGEDWEDKFYLLEGKGTLSDKGRLHLRTRLLNRHEYDIPNIVRKGWILLKELSKPDSGDSSPTASKKTSWKKVYCVVLEGKESMLHCFPNANKANHFIKHNFESSQTGKTNKNTFIIDLEGFSIVGSDPYNSYPSLSPQHNKLSANEETKSSSWYKMNTLIFQRKLLPPDGALATRFSTAQPEKIYEVSSLNIEDAQDWNEFLKKLAHKEASSTVDLPKRKEYTKLDSSTKSINSEIERNDTNNEEKERTEHILEGTLSLDSLGFRKRHYVILTPGRLLINQNKDLELREMSTQIDLKEVTSVSLIENETDPGFVIACNSKALSLAEYSKLQKMFTECEPANELGDFNNHKFYASSISSAKRWFKEIEQAVKSCQQNTHLWQSVMSKLNVKRIERFLKQGASAGGENLLNGQLILHHVLCNRNPESTKDEAAFLEAVSALYYSYPYALETPIAGTSGYFPIHQVIAQDYPSVKCLEFILSKLPDAAYQRTDEWDSPMHIACRWGNVKAVKFLVESCSYSPLFQNKNKQISLHSLTCRVPKRSTIDEEEQELRRVEILKILNDHADLKPYVTAVDNTQATPMHLACKFHGTGLVKALVEMNSQGLWCNDYYMNRPFHYACQRIESSKGSLSSMDMATYVGSVFFCNQKNADGKTPIDLVVSNELRSRLITQIQMILGPKGDSKLDGNLSKGEFSRNNGQAASLISFVFMLCAGYRSENALKSGASLSKGTEGVVSATSLENGEIDKHRDDEVTD